MCVATAACDSFEDRNVVIDMRILSMVATPPEQVVDLTTTHEPSNLLAELVPVQVCALVTDPNYARRLRYQFTVCDPDQGRCDTAAPHQVIARGFVDDPDSTVPAPRLCATVQPDVHVLDIALAALRDDALHGLGGVRLGVELRAGGEDADPESDQFSLKSIALQPKIPAMRTANTNPFLRGVSATIDGTDVLLEVARCAEAVAPPVVRPGQKLRLTPLEPEGVREVYVVPTLAGDPRTFTETLTYQWVVNGGSLSRGTTGGSRDRFGNTPTLFTDFTAPRLRQASLEISVWITQRDERLGASWLESCVRVESP